METKQKLEADLKDAMRSNNDVARRTIRMALSAIKLSEVEKGGQLEEANVLTIIQKEIKSRQESIADAQKANRPDLITSSEAEIVFLERYLPQQLTPIELEALARAAVSEVQAKTPADMGKVMKVLLPQIQGRAAGDKVSQVVRQILLAG